MPMTALGHAELLDLFLNEAHSYLPEIRLGVSTLEREGATMATLEELHRLFHNIKGAASQVQLIHLSRGAKIVENLLAEIVEEGRPMPVSLPQILARGVDLLEAFIERRDGQISTEEEFLLQISDLFATLDTAEEDRKGDGAALPEPRDKEEYILAARSLLPLLVEMAGFLSPQRGAEDNAKVYASLRQGVAVLAVSAKADGLRQHFRLLEEFGEVLEKLHRQPHDHLPETAGLILDFLRFLEVVYTYTDPESQSTVQRVRNQLRGVQLLLGISTESDSPEVTAVSPLPSRHDQDEDDIFTTLGDTDPGLLEQFTDELFMDDEEPGEVHAVTEIDDQEDSTGAFEDAYATPDDSEQQQLLEIFQAECEEHLINANRTLNILENEVVTPRLLHGQLRETISVMRRAVHTLKGAAAMTGMALTARGAHRLEDLLDWLHDDAEEITPQDVALIADGIDVIELLAQGVQSGEPPRLVHFEEGVSRYLAQRSSEGDEPGDQTEEAAEVPMDLQAWLDTDAEAGPFEAVTTALPGDSGILRVRLDDLDELVGIEGELIVARGAMEKMVEEFSDTVFELGTVKENLRRKSQELESGFEGQSLYGLNPKAEGGTVDGDFSEFDPIELDRYSQLNLIIRSLNEISVDVNSIATTLGAIAGDLRGQISKQQLTMRLMQEKLMRIRMTPMSTLSRILFRTVRETARNLDKKANLTITGEDVYMDRFVWAKITDPLMHMLRNALDHGIERPAERLGVGKAESGQISVAAEQRSRFAILRISDDGRGIDVDRVRQRALDRGLITPDQRISEKELLDFLFHPSFTTRSDVGVISGRGVGLDVVRRNIQELHGSIQLHNRPGRGVTFEISIPFTLSVNRALMVAVAGHNFAVPLQHIHQIKRFTRQEITISGDRLFLDDGAEKIDAVNLAYYLQLDNRRHSLAADSTEGVLAILFYREERLAAVVIEEIVEQREIVVKNLGSHLTHVPGISGVTLTGSGDMIPIINLRELFSLEKGAAVATAEVPVPTASTAPLKVLIVDDSISVRHSVTRLVESQGWKQQQAVDGVEALAKLEQFLPDVIILDIEMPRMNGYELKNTLNNNELYRDIPVIMLTSRASEKHQQKARELGIRHYMTKPYQEEVFVRLLEKLHRGEVW
jgi:chemosensory pili system protein ChpA (sensor histidine kinase/response regulator)